MSAPAEFQALHRTGGLVVLPNAWDVGSARILEHLGLRALGTTSSGSQQRRAVGTANWLVRLRFVLPATWPAR